LLEILRDPQAADDSVGVRILADVKQVFEESQADRMSSVDLVAALVAIETSPWSDCSRGKPLLTAGLAKLLKPFGIGPQSVRIGNSTPKGYYREHFNDAWKRYPSSRCSQAATAPHTNGHADSEAFQGRNAPSKVAADRRIKAKGNGVCGGVALHEAEESYVADLSGPGCTCRHCNSHFGTLAGWRAHIFRERCAGFNGG
jgi:hypothetical protein